MGSGLARRLARAGHTALLGSRDPERGRAMGKAIASGGGAVADVAADADVIILAVPHTAVGSTLDLLGDLSGTVVIDATNPRFAKAAGEVGGSHGPSLAEAIAARTPGAAVVKGFNSISAQVMHLSPVDDSTVAFLCGDDARGKRLAGDLARDMGFRPVDVGPLSSAHYLEAFAALMLGMAYELGFGADFALSLPGGTVRRVSSALPSSA